MKKCISMKNRFIFSFSEVPNSEPVYIFVFVFILKKMEENNLKVGIF